MKRGTYAMLMSTALAAGAAVPEAKADDAPSSAFNGNVTLASDYIFRSETQTNHHPALQATLEYDHASGFYVGTFGSNVSWIKDAAPDPGPGQRIHNNIETDLWLGYRNKIGEDWSYDVGLYYYYYPGDYPGRGYVKPHTFEAYAQVGWKFFSVRYWQSLSDWFGYAHSVKSSYTELNYNQEVLPSWTLGLHLARQYVAGAGGALSFTDWRLSVTKAFAQGFTLSAAYTQGDASHLYYTNPDGHYITRGTVTLSLAKAFSF